METDFLPAHLKKYVVEQHYEKYTPVDQAVWRFALRQLKDFLSKNAHECYVEGLKKTGIEVEQIPHIDQVSKKLQEFGWRALPVSGFIPPAAFMELQSLGVLPVASDMRTLDHLLYTPAPDIVHEAAGHAPILIHPEFAEYLRRYAQVAKKAIISKEDLDLYEAIRDLSDLKEHPSSTPAQIKEAELKLEQVSKNMSHISEATELSRMNWWTAEYGLIGSLENPKLFGAGLLSSVGESKWCLSEKVKKIPLTVDCIKMTYDITEPQPQLFVTPDFATLTTVLEDMAETMAFRIGGLTGLQKAIQAQSANTAELNSGIQISGEIQEALTDSKGQLAYLKVNGPTQLSFQDKELKGHDKSYHAHGFGTPVGFLKQFPTKCPSTFTAEEWKQIGAQDGQALQLEFTSGVTVKGQLKSRLQKGDRTLVLVLENATVAWNGKILFDPSWGTFDMALGSTVTSVFGGPADRIAYGETVDFVAKRVPTPNYSAHELALHQQYASLRHVREQKTEGMALEQALTPILNTQDQDFANDWLLRVEALELLKARAPSSKLISRIEQDLTRISGENQAMSSMISDGIRLSGAL